MGILERLWPGGGKAAGKSSPRASGEAYVTMSLTDPKMIEFLRDGLLAASGFTVNVETALKNPAMFRAVSLISNSIGMLPLHLKNQATKKKAVEHPLFKVLHRKPNSFQPSFDFRAMMQLRALVHKNAYALVLRSTSIRTGKKTITGLVLLDPRRMTVKMLPDWTLDYIYQPLVGSKVHYKQSDIFHLRGMSLDGINGFSLVEQAREAIGLALSAELAAAAYSKTARSSTA